MAIVKMKKLRLLGLLSERDDFLNALLPLGCVEVTNSHGRLDDLQYAELLHPEPTRLSEFRTINSRLAGALDKLKKYAPAKEGLFIKRRDISPAEFFSSSLWSDSLSAAADINSAEDDINRLYSEKSRLDSSKKALAPWLGLDVPLETTGTAQTSVLLGTIPAARSFNELEQALAAEAELSSVFLCSADKELQYFMLICHNSQAEKALDVLRSFGYASPAFKNITGTAAEASGHIAAQMEKIDARIQDRVEQIRQYASKRGDLRVCLDRSVQEITRENAKERLLSTDLIYSLEGWVSQTGLEQFEQLAADYCCAYELEDPAPEEEAPILLKNSWLVSTMHMVVEMYSLPSYHGIDPCPLIFPFFVFYYGLMFADIGYGLIMLAAGLWLIKAYKPKGAFGQIADLAVVLGASSAICGVLTGSLFGDAVTVIADSFLGRNIVLWSIINPLSEPMTVLIFAIVMGAIHMCFGQIIHIYMGFRDNKGIDGLLDVVPWWTLFAGIALAALKGNYVLLWIGVLFLVATQGRHKDGFFGKLFGGITSLYDVTSWLGDILSYSRIMALMLATTVIASVVNILGTLPGSVFAFIPIFLFGHIFNLGINIIGTYVHAARLQYLEFFGKFYVDGGTAFSPLAYNTKYVDIVTPRLQEVK